MACSPWLVPADVFRVAHEYWDAAARCMPSAEQIFVMIPAECLVQLASEIKCSCLRFLDGEAMIGICGPCCRMNCFLFRSDGMCL